MYEEPPDMDHGGRIASILGVRSAVQQELPAASVTEGMTRSILVETLEGDH